MAAQCYRYEECGCNKGLMKHWNSEYLGKMCKFHYNKIEWESYQRDWVQRNQVCDTDSKLDYEKLRKMWLDDLWDGVTDEEKEQIKSIMFK